MAVKLFIKDSLGEITEIELRDSEFKSYTVQQLKTKIQEKTTRDFSHSLIFKWCLLKDDAKLSDYGIQHESTIQLGTQHLTKTLFIQDARGPTNIFCLEEEEFRSCCLEHLKRRIQDTLGIPEEKQRLIYQGKRLADGRTLSDYGIQDLATILLLLRLRGGRTDPEEGAGGMGDKGGKNRTPSEQQRDRNSQTNSTDMVVRVAVRGLRGETMMIDLCDTVEQFKSITVLQLKEKINERLNYSHIPDQQRLIYAGNQLEDNRTLSECGISNKSTIDLVIRCRGGGVVPEKGAGGMGDKGGKNRSMEDMLYF
ncbi:uncharacterized protein [Cebidichthys violaceus]|uniref:uncharacterized protein isoform X2 n=1 Tax=Cebidichthys violaceus TaxID=271503 RepID=UPI0035C9BF7E